MGDAIKTSDEICSSINYHVINALKVKKGDGKRKQQPAGKWSRSPSGILKVITDGAFQKDSNGCHQR